MIRLAIAALFLTTLAAPAMAQDDSKKRIKITPQMIMGKWAFKAHTADNCEFNGTTVLSQQDENGLFGCELVARQACPSFEFVVRQSCTARLSKGQLIIRSEIEEFLVGEPTSGYYPDNFILTVRSAERMTGSLMSIGTYASEFTRQTDATS